MDLNPFIGIGLYALGGLSGACFYLPFKGVRQWSWESYWMIYAVAGLVLVPWALAFAVSPNVLAVLRQTSWQTLFWCYVFGAMWGVGGLTWGLMIRYLGVGLGLAIGCGLCASAGTLIPPLVRGKLAGYAAADWGLATLAGVGLALLGIIVTGAAGMSKERELSAEQKKNSVAEFDFRKGVAGRHFFRDHERGHGLRTGRRRGNPARHLAHATPNAGDVAGHPRAGSRAVRRLHRQFPLVLVSEPEEPQRRRLHPRRHAPDRQPAVGRRGRRHLVLSVRPLQGGRCQERRPHLWRLDRIHVQHDHLQHAAGNSAAGMAGRERPHQAVVGRQPDPAGGLAFGHRLRQLLEEESAPASTVRPSGPARQNRQLDEGRGRGGLRIFPTHAENLAAASEEGVQHAADRSAYPGPPRSS